MSDIKNLSSEEKDTKQTVIKKIITADGNLEGKFAIIQDVVFFVKKNFQPVLNTLLIISIGLFIYLGFRVMQSEISRLEDLTQHVDDNVGEHVEPVQPEDIEERFKIDQIINSSLEEARQETKASRAFLFQFHNGEHSVGQFNFLYASETHEVVGNGISHNLQINQHIPASIGYEQGNMMIERGYYCSTAEQMGNSSLANFLKQRGVVAICSVPVLNMHDEIIGFIGVDFADITTYPSDPTTLLPALRKHTAEIEGILHTMEQNGTVNLHAD